MLKNNLISLFLHTVISLLLVYIFGDDMFVGASDYLIKIGIIISLLYIIISYYLFIPTESILKDYLSVISVFIVGMIVWFFSFSGTEYGELADQTWNGILWLFYYAYVYPFYLLTIPLQDLLFEKFSYVNLLKDIINIYLIIIPSFLFWIGLLLKRRMNRRRLSFYKTNGQ